MSASWREPNPAEELLDMERIRLIFDVNVSLRRGWRQWHDGQNATTLDLYPAQELVRVARPTEQSRDWESRWMAGGGRMVAGRMIALKNDPVWLAISAFGYPFSPFDVNSMMHTRDIWRREAMTLGMIDRDTRVPLMATPPMRPAMFYFDALPEGRFATPYLSADELVGIHDDEDDSLEGDDSSQEGDSGGMGWSARPFEIVQEITYFLKNCPNSLTVEKAAEFMDQLTEAVQSVELSSSPWIMARAYRCTGEILDRLEQTDRALEYYGYALQLDPQVGVRRRVGALTRILNKRR